MSLLITPTILNSMDWFNKCPESWKERAYEDLLNTLNRVWVEPKGAIKRGIDFEKYIYEKANNPSIIGKCSEKFQQIIDEVKGGLFQVKRKSFFEINGKEYCLFNKIDVLKNNLIIDIKTTGEYKGKKYYLEGWQHKCYCFSTKICNFKYLIIEFMIKEEDDKLEINDTYYVDYFVESFDEIKNEIKEKIKLFIDFINNNMELSKAYYEKFNLYY